MEVLLENAVGFSQGTLALIAQEAEIWINMSNPNILTLEDFSFAMVI